MTNPDAPPSPLALPEYQPTATADAHRLDEEAAALAAEVPGNVQRASNHMLGVVLFAVSLFFAGMSATVDGPRPRTVLLIVGCIGFLTAVAWIASLPITVSVSVSV